MRDPRDEADEASEREQHMTQQALEKVMRSARPEQVQNADGSWPFPECINCDEPVESERLALGKWRCFGCQVRHETERRFAR